MQPEHKIKEKSDRRIYNRINTTTYSEQICKPATQIWKYYRYNGKRKNTAPEEESDF